MRNVAERPPPHVSRVRDCTLGARSLICQQRSTSFVAAHIPPLSRLHLAPRRWKSSQNHRRVPTLPFPRHRHDGRVTSKRCLPLYQHFPHGNQGTFSSTPLLLAADRRVQDSMIKDADCVELGLTCTHVCQAPDRGSTEDGRKSSVDQSPR